MRLNKRGITLIELMLAVALMGIVSTGAYKLYSLQLSHYSTQQDVTYLQRDLRMARNQLIKKFRLAGFGIPRALKMGIGDSLYAVTPFYNPADPDSVRIAGNFNDLSTLVVNSMANPSDNIIVQDVKKFRINHYAFIDNGIEREAFYITDTDTLTNELMHAPLSGVYSTGSIVSDVITYTFYIDRSDPVCPRLCKNADGKISTIADHIEDLILTYNTVNGETVNPMDPASIIGIRFEIASRSNKKDYPWQAQSGDAYKHRKIEYYVMLRNLQVN